MRAASTENGSARPASPSSRRLQTEGGPADDDETDGEVSRHGMVDDEVAEMMPPYPRRQVWSLGLILCVVTMNATVLFSFLPALVKFLTRTGQGDVGYYAGGIAAMFWLGRAISAQPWGRASDMLGRKMQLWASLVSMIVSAALLGFCTALPEVMVLRFVAGLFSPIVAATKVVASELCGPEHSARAVSVVSISLSAGTILGPALGGALAQEPDPGVAYPFWRPMMTLAGLGLACVPVLYFWVPETLATTPLPGPLAVRIHHVARTLCGCPASASYRAARTDDGGEWADRKPLLLEAEGAGDAPKPQQPKASIMSRPLVLRVLLLYAGLNLVSIIMDETYPLWATDSLHFHSREIGFSLAGMAAIMAALNAVAFPPWAKKFGARAVFAASVLVTAPATVALVYIGDWLGGSGSPSRLWPALMTVGALRWTARGFAFSASFMLVNNLMPKKRRGEVNGLAMALGSVAKAAGPALAGSIYASSTGHGRFPFDQHLVFFLVTGLSVLLGVLGLRWVPESLNAPPPEPGDDVELEADLGTDSGRVQSGAANDRDVTRD